MQKKKPEIRSRFTESAPVSSDTVGQADTQQQFAKEADINHKARQHLAALIVCIPWVTRRLPA